MQNGSTKRFLTLLAAAVALACGSSAKHDLDLAQSELSVTPTTGVVADGVQAVTIELVARDTHGLPLAGVVPTLSVTGTGNVLGAWTGAGGEATQTSADGTLHITLASTKAETKTIGVKLRAGSIEGDATHTVEATFAAGPITSEQSTATPPATATVADGSTPAAVVLVVRDAQGNPVSGAEVTAVVTGGATVNGPLTTGADGTVTFLVTSGHSGTVDVTFTVGSTTVGTSQVAFAAGAAASLLFGTVDSTVTAGQPLSPFTVTVLDANSNVVASATGAVGLSLSVNPGSDTLGGTTSVAAASGVASFTDVALHKVGTGYVLTASYAGLTSVSSTAIAVTAAAADPSHTLVQASGSPTVGESQTVTVVVRDAWDNPVSGETVTFAASGGATVSSGGVSDADGVVTGTVTTTTAGAVIVSAYLGSTAVAQTPSVTFQSAAPASGGSTAVAGSAAIANGTATTTITVTVKDAYGNPVPNAVVGASASNGAVIDGPITSGADGTATFTVSSTTTGSSTVTFTSGGVTIGSGTVSFVAGAAAQLAFSSAPSSATAGTALAPVVVRVLDAHGNLVTTGSTTVTISTATAPSGETLAGTLSVASSSGLATFSDLVLHKVGTATLSAQASGATSATTGSITVGHGAADLAHSQVSAEAASVQVGGSMAITVLVRDAYGNPVPGETVTLSTSPSTNTVTQPASASASDGSASGSITGTVSGNVTVTAHLTAGDVAQTASFAFLAGDVAEGNSTAVAGAPAVANGTATTTITVTVKDAYGNPVPNAVVGASASNGAVIDGPITSGADGTATFTVSSTTSGTSTVTFTSGGVTIGSGTVSFVAGAAAQLAFSSAPSSATAGTALAPVVVQVLDAHGNLVTTGSSTVTISTATAPSGEVLAGTLSAASSNGLATFSDLVLHKAGTTTLSAQASGLTDATSGAITVGHGPIDATQSLVWAATATATAGSSTAITVKLMDAEGNPISGQSVTLTADPVTVTVVQPVGTTAADGTITGSVSTQTASDVTVSAQAGSTALLQTGGVLYQAGAVDPDQSTFSVSPASQTADGSTTSTLSVTAKDAYGNAVSGKAVVFSATGTNTLVQPPSTNASGQSQGTIASSETGTKTLTATVDGVTLSTHPTIAFSAVPSTTPSAALSTVVPSPATIQADGTTQSAIVVTVLDSGGAPIADVAVTLTLTAGTGTLTQPSSVTDASGVATGHISATAAGSGTISASAGGVALTQTATVSYVTAITETVPPQKVTLPVGVNCTTQYSNTGRKITADQANNIYVVMNCGGTAYAAVSTDLGNTYSTAQSLGMTNVAEVSTVGGPAGIAYALAIDDGGGAWFSRTTDSGVSWSVPVQIETTASTAYGATIAVDNDWVYIACNTGSAVRVFRNATQGAGAFDSTDIVVSAVFGDVLTDTDGSVWVTTDDPTFHILKSTDHGVTFGPESNPSGSANYSDWSIGNGVMWVTGTQDYATRIPSSAPGTSSSVTGLVTVDSRGRAVSADEAGNAYIVSGMSGTGVTLQRALASADAFDAGRLIDANGSWPGVVAGPGNNTAILVYTVGSDVWASVQVY